MIDVYVEGLSIDIGRQGENLAKNIYFDLSELINTYGEGTATLVHMRPSDQAPYVCTATRSGAFLIWAPTSTDTAYAGSGKCELRWVVGDTLAKSIVYNTAIAPSIMQAGQIPDPYLSWYDAMMNYIKNNYSEGGVPQEVREAIYTLLSKAAYTETGLADELATVQAWTVANYTIRNNLTNVTTNNDTGIVVSGSSYTATLTGATGYVVGSVTVTMGGEDVTNTVYSNGVITIAEVTGDVVITASGVVPANTYSVTYNLSNVTSTNESEIAVEDESYSTTLTANAGYTISSVIITMGGADITSTVYSGGVVNVQNVTGNIVITAAADVSAYLDADLTYTEGDVLTASDGTTFIYSPTTKYYAPEDVTKNILFKKLVCYFDTSKTTGGLWGRGENATQGRMYECWITGANSIAFRLSNTRYPASGGYATGSPVTFDNGVVYDNNGNQIATYDAAGLTINCFGGRNGGTMNEALTHITAYV